MVCIQVSRVRDFCRGMCIPYHIPVYYQVCLTYRISYVTKQPLDYTHTCTYLVICAHIQHTLHTESEHLCFSYFTTMANSLCRIQWQISLVLIFVQYKHTSVGVTQYWFASCHSRFSSVSAYSFIHIHVHTYMRNRCVFSDPVISSRLNTCHVHMQVRSRSLQYGDLCVASRILTPYSLAWQLL